MNAQRRKEIGALLNELAELRRRVETLHDGEQEAFDNMPEGLQNANRGQAMEAAVSALDNALSAFDEIETSLAEAAA